MSEAESPAATAIGTNAPIQPVAQPVVTAAPPVASPSDQQDPQWLPARLERERKSIARRLGVESIDDVESKLKKLSKLEAERMSEAEKMQARIKALEPLEGETKQLREAVALMAKRELASLTEQQRAIVEDLSGGDPSRAIATIEKLRPTWAAAAPTQAAPVPPASTTPATPAPAAVAPPSENHLATWERLKATNPMWAASYFVENFDAISEARKRVTG